MSAPFLISFSAAAMLALTWTSAHADDYRFDTVHTQVFFCVSHLGFSNPCGRMHVNSGFFHFDAGAWAQAKVDVVVDTASLDMGDAKWNATLRSSRFLETNMYPTAHFMSTSVEKTADHSAIVHGKLSVRGVTRPVDLHVTFNRAGLDSFSLHYTAGFSATATLARSEYGIRKYLPDIGDIVTVRIEAEGLRDRRARAESMRKEP
ncbi:MAG: YceI family protein [Rudaea sp.]